MSPDKTRVSVVAFSQYVNILMKFKDLYSEQKVMEAVDDLKFEGSVSRMVPTLEAVHYEVFSKKSGARPRTPGKLRTVEHLYTITSLGEESSYRSIYHLSAYLILSYLILSYLILSYFTLPNPTLSYPILSCLSIYLSIHPSIHPSIHLSIRLSVYLSYLFGISFHFMPFLKLFAKCK